MIYTPKQAADVLQTSDTTVRRYSTWFAGHLSPSASPPMGQRREFTQSDIAILKRAKALLDRGLTIEQVDAQLGVLPPEEPEPEPEEAPEPAEAGQAEPGAGAALALWQGHQNAIDLQARLVADQAERLTQQGAQIAAQRELIAGQGAQIAALERQLDQLRAAAEAALQAAEAARQAAEERQLDQLRAAQEAAEAAQQAALQAAEEASRPRPIRWPWQKG